MEFECCWTVVSGWCYYQFDFDTIASEFHYLINCLEHDILIFYFYLTLLNLQLVMKFQQLFGEAIQNGTMEGFFKLISYFQTQSEPAYCGLASLSMVLNALAIDPGRKWKGKPYFH